MAGKSDSFKDHLNEILVSGEIIAALGGGMAGPIADAKMPISDPVEKQGIELMSNLGDALEERYGHEDSSDLRPVDDGVNVAISEDVTEEYEPLDVSEFFSDLEDADVSGDEDSESLGFF